MNVFERDNTWQRGLRDAILAPHFYGKYAVDGRYVCIDKGKLATCLQKQFAVDTIMQGRDGAAVCIEEKIVRWPAARNEPYTAFTLETMSCTVDGRESPGWMKYGRADYLLYCFADSSDTRLQCYLMDFRKLQDWFWPIADTFPKTVTKQINKTECRVVQIHAVLASVPTWVRAFPSQE